MEKGINGKKLIIRVFCFVMALLLVLGMTLAIVPQNVFAESFATQLKLTGVGEKHVMQGNSADIRIKLENQTDSPLTYDEVVITFEDKNGLKCKVKPVGETTLKGKGSSSEIGFEVTVSRYYPVGTLTYYFTLKNDGEEVYVSRHLYVAVTEYSATGETSTGEFTNSIEINSSVEPSEFFIGTDNYIYFEFYNGGNGTIKSATAKLTLPDGVGINGGSNSATIGQIQSGKTKNSTFNLSVDKEAVSGNKVFTVTLTGKGQNNEDISVDKSFYVYVNAKEGKKEEPKDAETNPRIMVQDYSFNAASITAGNYFPLSLNLINTSKKDLYNIKVSLTSDGTFVPAGGSNAFYIETLETKATTEQSIKLRAVPDADQKTAAITVSMSYEDAEGTAYTAEDIISIKVNQKTRLVIGEIIPPMEAYAGDQCEVTINYYNMGKTQLSNLMIDASGNFDSWESNADFVGNFASGASGEYSLYAVPLEPGTVEGTITFSYDDIEGNTCVEEVPFSFEAMEFEPFEDPGWDEPVEEEPMIPQSLIIAGIVLAVLIIAAIAFTKIRKSRINKRLEIEDAEFELESKKSEGDANDAAKVEANDAVGDAATAETGKEKKEK